jgi:hypothetical protein
VVKQWSNSGKTGSKRSIFRPRSGAVVKQWSNNGQIVVKQWSDRGRSGRFSGCGRSAVRLRGQTASGQTAVNNGPRLSAPGAPAAVPLHQIRC